MPRLRKGSQGYLDLPTTSHQSDKKSIRICPVFLRQYFCVLQNSEKIELLASGALKLAVLVWGKT